MTMDKWLTLEQIAKYLQMSTSSIYKMAQAGKIPAYKVGSGDLRKRKLIIGLKKERLQG